MYVCELFTSRLFEVEINWNELQIPSYIFPKQNDLIFSYVILEDK